MRPSASYRARMAIEELRQKRRLMRGGVFSLHVGPTYRGLFVRNGRVLKFIAFGVRIPEADVYAMLARVRKELTPDERR
ncbi:MAG: hypothetical protein ACREB9_05500 [Thermoplasmata archaeon]